MLKFLFGEPCEVTSGPDAATSEGASVAQQERKQLLLAAFDGVSGIGPRTDEVADRFVRWVRNPDRFQLARSE